MLEKRKVESSGNETVWFRRGSSREASNRFAFPFPPFSLRLGLRIALRPLRERVRFFQLLEEGCKNYKQS